MVALEEVVAMEEAEVDTAEILEIVAVAEALDLECLAQIAEVLIVDGKIRKLSAIKMMSKSLKFFILIKLNFVN